MMKLKYTEAKLLTPNHTASRWRSYVSNPGSVAPNSTVIRLAELWKMATIEKEKLEKEPDQIFQSIRSNQESVVS